MNKKNIFKWILVIALISVIIYTFRDQAGPISEQLKTTAPAVIAGICLLSVGYELLEGCITTLLAREYHPSFRCVSGVINAFLCCFYRVATLGSGTGVAAIVYLGEKGLEYSESFGLYMLQYAFHKIGIAIFSGIMFLVSFSYMTAEYGDYMWLLAGGYGLTASITLVLILFCCSRRFHRAIFLILDLINRIVGGKLDAAAITLHEQCDILESASAKILGNGILILKIIILILIRCSFWYAIPYIIFGSEAGITLPQVMAVTSLSVMIAAVIPTPAGIGSTEFVFTSLFAAAVGSDMALSASLLYRFATFVFPFLIGGVIVIIRRIRKR